ncbi:hypothetical protein PTTW11_00654 [Pyrenophora teres f. teres]|uniref:Uncharacterized protein n=1 Tax=Pyrenophora teres f. teres TaxID=97479 RepID=A0A6S6VUW4_9PLEO|nr:hypothetical protein PTTW11_00654 [Pyrenophora teres f. teres]
MEDESGFDIDKVSPIWIVTALCIVPLGLYYMLNLLSPLMHLFTDMRISEVTFLIRIVKQAAKIIQIYVYPIKSLRTLPMKEAIATPHGFKHDRTFMLLQKTESGYKNMAVSRYPEMTQFLQTLDTTNSTISVTYLAYGDTSKETTIQVPLNPDTEPLDPIEITMYSSSTSAYIMPDNYNDWFTSHFGYPVLLIYLSTNRRRVLFQDMLPTEPPALSRIIKTYIPIPTAFLPSSLIPPSPPNITFADCAPYLLCSATSLSNVSARLPPGTKMDVSKFRPNLVVSGAAEPFEEDYWARVLVAGKTEIALKHNCVRCKSINVDYGTGKQGEGPEGEVLKRLQKDRRVDGGRNWSPVFGRYGFWGAKGEERGKEVVWRVGDGVRVVGTNNERTAFTDPKSKPVPTLPNGHLINLPNEALLQIASHLQGTFKERTPHCDLISLVSTCKRFPPIIRKVLYTTPILDSAKVSSLLQILFRYPDLRSKFYSLTVVSNPIRGQKAVNLGTPRTLPMDSDTKKEGATHLSTDAFDSPSLLLGLTLKMLPRLTALYLGGTVLFYLPLIRSITVVINSTRNPLESMPNMDCVLQTLGSQLTTLELPQRHTSQALCADEK